MDQLYDMVRWLKGLDLVEVLLYLALPLLIFLFVLDWFKNFFNPHR